MRKWVGILLALAPFVASAVDVVTEGSVACEEYRLNRDLRVYKDPTLFLEALRDRPIGADPFLSESPLLTTVKGKVRFMKLGPEQPFRGFGNLARLYGLSEHRLKKQHALVVPVMFCGGGDAYTDTLGFVLVEDLKDALKARAEAKASLPPSTYPNPIPEWKKGG